MGIPSYFSHIIKNHRNIIENVNSVTNVQNLYLDCNSIVYDAAYKLSMKYTDDVSFEKLILNEVKNTLITYINTIHPKRVFIAFDGVAPVAKLQQQRERRFKSNLFSELYSEVGIKSSTQWNNVVITPGTEFMEKLHEYFITFDKELKIKCNFLENIIISTWKDHGEGEHKIFNFIRNNDHRNDTTFVYGLDADLIMLSICHLKYCSKLYLYRETPEFIKHIDSTLKPNESYILNISNLGDQIYQMLSFDKNNKKLDILHDYIFLCFLLGNDFMPHFPALNIRSNGIYHLIDCYKSLMKTTITEEHKIKWNVFRLFVKHLSQYEEQWIQEEYDSICKQENIFYKLMMIQKK